LQNEVEHGAAEIPKDGRLEAFLDFFGSRQRGRITKPTGYLLVVGDYRRRGIAGVSSNFVGKERGVEGGNDEERNSYDNRNHGRSKRTIAQQQGAVGHTRVGAHRPRPEGSEDTQKNVRGQSQLGAEPLDNGQDPI
jgi:hypothetical protein